MKTKLLLAACVLLSLSGCTLEFSKGKGFAFKQSLPPTENKIVRIEGSSIGVSVGQNPATQTPEGVIGYKHVTYTSVPTSTNTVYAAPLRATIGVGLKPGIAESIEAGEEAVKKEPK